METAHFSADWHCTGVGGRCTRVGGLLRPTALSRKGFFAPFRNKIEYPRTLYFTYGSPDRIRVQPCRVDAIP